MKASASLLKDLQNCASAVGSDVTPNTMKAHAGWLREIAGKLEREAQIHVGPVTAAIQRRPLDSRPCKDA